MKRKGEIMTFLGDVKRSAYRARAERSVQGPGKGGGREPPKGIPSSPSE